MAPSSNAIVRSVDEPERERQRRPERVERFDRRDYPLMFGVLDVATVCPYLPLGFKDFLYDHRQFNDNTLFRLCARHEAGITLNGTRGFPDATTSQSRTFSLIRWLYLLQDNKSQQRCEKNAVKKYIANFGQIATRSNLLELKAPTEFFLPTKGFVKRLKYYRSQDTAPNLICPLCYDNNEHKKTVLNSIASFHDHMVCHGQIEIFGCGKCRRIYPNVWDYENHVCKDQEPKSKEFSDVIYAISCCECGFASRYDPKDSREESVKKIQQILLNHNNHRLLILKLSATKVENHGENANEKQSWTGQLKLKLRRNPSHSCNLPGCQHIKLDNDCAFRQHLLTHLKSNRISFLFTIFLKNCILPGYSGTLTKSVKTPEPSPNNEDYVEIFETNGHTQMEAENDLDEIDWSKEYKDTVAFKIAFDDSLPGVANATARTFLCKNCYLITFGNTATILHIRECHNPNQLKYTRKAIFSEIYCWQLGAFNHLPNEPIPCVVANCGANLCSIQGFMVHFAEKHGLVANIDYKSAGGYGSSHRTPWRHRESYVVKETNQFCGLTTDGQLPLDLATNIMEGRYSEEVLAQQEDLDLGWVEGPEEMMEEESDAELEPRDLYPENDDLAQSVEEEMEADQTDSREISMEIVPQIQTQVEEEPQENGQDRSSPSDAPGPSSAQPLTVPRLIIKRSALSTEARNANGLTDDELPSDYLAVKRRKDEKRREKWEKTQLSRKRSRQTDEEIDATMDEVIRMAKTSEGQPINKEKKGEEKRKKREEEKRKKRKEDDAAIRENINQKAAIMKILAENKANEKEKEKETPPIPLNFGNRCFDCGLEFETSEMSLADHYKHHGFYRPENPEILSIDCYTCLEVFNDVDGFLQHVLKMHSKPNEDTNSPKQRTCNECAWNFTNEDMINHVRYYCHRSRNCGQCGMLWKPKKVHERNAHTNKNHKASRRFWCSCRGTVEQNWFASIVDFEKHSCPNKKLIKVTMDTDLLLGASINVAVVTALKEASEKTARKSRREEGLPVLQQLVNDPATYPGSAGPFTRITNQVAESREVDNQLASATCVPVETGEIVMEADSPAQSVVAEPSTSPALSQADQGTSEGSKESGILSQALKDAGIPTASQELRPVPGPSTDNLPEPVTSTSADQPAVEGSAQMPSTSSGPVNGENIVTTTTSVVDEDDDEIVCLSEPLPDIEVLPVAPAVQAREAAVADDDDDEIMEIDAPSTSRAERPANFHCDICNKGFKTRGSMESHKITEHQRDIGILDKRLISNVYGIPFTSQTFVCPHCVMVFEDQHRHQEHMKYHLELGVELLICEYCTVQALSHDGLHKHILNHGIDSTRRRERLPNGNIIENWCTMCTPMLSFPSDAGYYLHVIEVHKVPIYYFCKNCLMGSCLPDVICNHIMSGHCTEKRVYERTIGFAIASDLHFQPQNEAAHVEKLRQSPNQYVKPHSCSTRSFLKYYSQNATCEEVEPGDHEKCFGLINFYSFENRHCQKLNYHVPDKGPMPKEFLPDHKFVNLNYNLYRWLEWKVHGGQQPMIILYDVRPNEQMPELPPMLNWPISAVGRRSLPRMVAPPPMVAGPSGIQQRHLSRSSRASSSSRGPEIQSTSNGNQAATIQTIALQRIVLNCVSNPESRIQIVENEYSQITGMIIDARSRNASRAELELLYRRHNELRAMRHRLTYQIQSQQDHGSAFFRFCLDVPANEVPNYQAEMLPVIRPQVAPPSRPLMDIQVARPAVPQQDPAEILRPVHQNQQAVQPRETRRTEESGVFKCAICDQQFPTTVQVRLMGKIEDFVSAILRSAVDIVAEEVFIGIQQRMSRNTSVCFLHANPHAASVINRDTFVVTHANHNMVVYNYLDYAYPALDKNSYANVLREASNQLLSGQMTHGRFITELRSANKCHFTTCTNSSLSNMNACKLHGYHMGGVGQLLCTHCWQSFTNEQQIIAHVMAMHSRANQHGRIQIDLRCPVPDCAVGFDSAANLRAHFEQAHKARFPYTTACCSQIFATEAARNEHNATHLLIRSPRCCPLCGACNPFEGVAFGRFKNMTHLFRHACQIRYTCKICMEGFLTHSRLISHCRNVHNIGGRAPLVCTHCGNLPLKPQEVVHHITTTHELHLFTVDQVAPPVISCPPEMTEFLGLTR